MSKKINMSYPAIPAGLSRALADAEAVAAKLRHLDAAVDEMPAKRAQASAVVDDAKRQLAAKDVASIFPDADRFAENEISHLEADVAHGCAALDRLDRQSEAMQAMGAALNTEMDTATAALAVERDAYATAVQALARVVGGPFDWQEFAHVSDPRAARRSYKAGGVPFDTAPNLLTQAAPEAEAAVGDIRRALEPIETAKRLARTPQYRPRAQHVNEGRASTNKQD
jgi:hypothetical protein